MQVCLYLFIYIRVVWYTSLYQKPLFIFVLIFFIYCYTVTVSSSINIVNMQGGKMFQWGTQFTAAHQQQSVCTGKC